MEAEPRETWFPILMFLRTVKKLSQGGKMKKKLISHDETPYLQTARMQQLPRM